MKDFYEAFYAVVAMSPAHHAFCERAFGKDLCQHGFASLEQLELLLEVAQLGPAHHVLDLGCGNGRITEYLSDRSGAHITGLDLISRAISQAQQRTAAQAARLTFLEGDINRLQLPAGVFDVILSIDTIYFSEDYTRTLRELKAALRPEGQMAILYTYSRESRIPKDEFPRDTLLPDRTPLAEALKVNGLTFRTWDLTRQDYAAALLRKDVLAELRPLFEAEGALFIYENRLGEVRGICQAFEDGLHARYLYLAHRANAG